MGAIGLRVMHDITPSDIFSWLNENEMVQAIKAFEKALEVIDSQQVASHDIPDGNEVCVIVRCGDPGLWIGTAFAGILSGVCTCFVPPDLPMNQYIQIVNQLPGSRLMFDGAWAHLGANSQFSTPARKQLQGKLLIPTGGSSGNTKFAVHDSDTLQAAVCGVADFFSDRSEAVTRFNYCHDLPLHHVSGWMQVFRSFLSGGRYFLGKDARMHWRELDSGRFLSVVPTLLRKMLADPEGLKTVQAADIVVVGGGPCPDGLLRECIRTEVFPWVTYGMTETLGMIAGKQIRTIEDLEKAATVFPHAKVRVVDEMGETLDAMERGEIVVESPALCRGYVYENGCGVPIDLSGENPLNTRDWGSMDRDGNLHVWGRMDQLIITGGEKVNPREVEAVIEANSRIMDAYVGSLPDEEWGERVVCLYVAKPGVNVSPEELDAFLRKQLESFKIPKSWAALDHLPYDEKGKLPVAKLQALIREVFA